MQAAQPEILLGGGHFADGQLLALQMRQLGIQVKLASILVAPMLPAFYEALGEMANGFMAPAHWEIGVTFSSETTPEGMEWFGPTQEEFINGVREISGGTDPNYHAACGGAAILAYVKAIELAQSLNPDDVREAMNDLHFMSFYGRWGIDPETGSRSTTRWSSWIFVLFAIPPLLSIPLALVLGMALGFIFFYLVIRHLVGAQELTTLLATFAIGILLEELAKFLWGLDYRGFHWEVGRLALPVTSIPMGKIYALIASIVIAIALYVWFRRTRSGTAIRAVMEDSEGARVCGVNVDWIYALNFAIEIGLTVLGGLGSPWGLLRQLYLRPH